MTKVRENNRLIHDLPRSNQLEISLFGPGFGECLVVHYGDGRWLTIDSCLEPDAETPSALAYLGALGLDPSRCVTHNIVTHFDGDHIGGILKLYAACSSAKLVLPGVFDNKAMNTFIHYFARYDPSPLTQTTKAILDLLTYQHEQRDDIAVYVNQDTLITSRNKLQVWALAPSNSKMEKFWASLSARKPGVKSDRRGVGRLRPNDVSVACLLERDGFSALFGADLEEEPSKGWTTLINSSEVYREFYRGAAVFKVPHHGSAGAHCPALWDAMERPFAILAPFKLGRHKIPDPNEISKILARTPKAFSTSSFREQSVKRLSRRDKILRQFGHRRREYIPNGHVRVRIDIDNNASLDLFRSAVHLTKIH